VAISEPAIVPDTVEAGREHVQQEPAKEFSSGQGQDLRACCVVSMVFVVKPHLPLLNIDHARVADGDAVRVPPNAVEDLRGTGEGPLGVDDPLHVARGREMLVEGRAIAERMDRTDEGEIARVERGLECGQEETSEESRQHPDGEKEPRAARDPPRAVEGRSAAGHDAVQMRMMDERLSPGVEDGEEADLRPEVARVGRDGPERLRRRAEEDPVDATLSRNCTTSAGLSTTGTRCGSFGAGMTVCTVQGLPSVIV